MLPNIVLVFLQFQIIEWYFIEFWFDIFVVIHHCIILCVNSFKGKDYADARKGLCTNLFSTCVAKLFITLDLM